MTQSSAHPSDNVGITLIGIPYDSSSSYLPGAALAPERIREAFHSTSTHLTTETGVDLTSSAIRDAGNMRFDTTETFVETIDREMVDLMRLETRVVSLGGDHAISYPILRAHHSKYPNITMIQFDAHPDLYESFEGNKWSHACPFARMHEKGLLSRHIQVGIRTLNSHQSEQAERYGVEIHTMRDGIPESLSDIEGPVYLSIDLDVLDPAFAPGVSHHEPGGLSTRELLRLLHSIEAPILGADIVELNPLRDIQGMTATVAAKILKEVLGLVERNHAL